MINMLDKKALLLKEIINEGKLADYEEIITDVIENILKYGFRISTR